MLERTEFEDSKTMETPVALETKLTKVVDEEIVKLIEYRSIVGSLINLSTRTRPDLAFAVGELARYCDAPGSEHWVALKIILRYLKNTKNLGLCYRKSNKGELVGFSDSDWAGDHDDRKSTSGYIFLYNEGPISWKSQKQRSVALSTVKAEYMALSAASQECIWIRNLLCNIERSCDSPTVIFEDNQSTISLTKNPQYHGRAKHIDIRYHFTRELVEANKITLVYCQSEDMVADMLTKGLSKVKFVKLLNLVGIINLNDLH
nr:secreted RxLR effector protein 161-like [Lepeophtheirus salmonis]